MLVTATLIKPLKLTNDMSEFGAQTSRAAISRNCASEIFRVARHRPGAGDSPSASRVYSAIPFFCIISDIRFQPGPHSRTLTFGKANAADNPSAGSYSQAMRNLRFLLCLFPLLLSG